MKTAERREKGKEQDFQNFLLCVCVHMSVCVCACVYTRGGLQDMLGVILSFFLRHHSPCFLRQGLPLVWGLLIRQTGQSVLLRDPLVFTSPSLRLPPCLAFVCGLWRLTSATQACTANTLETKSLPGSDLSMSVWMNYCMNCFLYLWALFLVFRHNSLDSSYSMICHH